MIHFSEPLYDKQDKIYGVIVTRYSINKINDVFKQVQQGQQQSREVRNELGSVSTPYQIDLVSNERIVIYSNYDPKSILKRNVTNLEIFKLLKNNSIGSSSSSSSPSDNKRLVFSTVEDQFGRKNIFVGSEQGNGYLDYKGSGWFLILGANYQEVYTPLQNLINQVLVSAGVILAIAIVIAFFFAEKISKPITRLKRLTQDLIMGQYDTKIETKSSDELGELASGFESMRKNVNEINKNLNSLVVERTIELQNANVGLRIKELQLENANEELIRRDGELEAVNEELRKTDRAKEEFISMVSHEVKTPLGPAKGYIEMLLRPKIAGELSEKQKKYANTIYRNIQKLEVLVSDVLDVYKLDMGKLKLSKSDIEVRNLLSSVQEDLRLLTLDKEINVMVQDRTNQGTSVFCDPKRIEQVLANLIKNSIDFVPERDGKIIVTVQEDPENQSMVRFSIEDNGIGIPSEKIDKLFNKFYQIDTTATRKHGGTGLGLAICRGIVENHGGRIWVDKGYVNGARIIFMTSKFENHTLVGHTTTIYKINLTKFEPAEGVFGNALAIYGSKQQYLSVPNQQPGINPATFSVSFWMKQDPAYLGNSSVISHVNLAKTAGWYFTFYTRNSQSYIQISITNSEGKIFSASSRVDPGVFDNVVGTFDGKVVKIYLNGFLVDSIAFVGNYNTDPDIPLNVGLNSYDYGRSWNGAIDEYGYTIEQYLETKSKNLQIIVSRCLA